jgi:hypothetical protein
VIGPIIIAVVILIIIPVGFLMTNGIVAAIFGYLLSSNAEEMHEGSELLETNY